MQPLKQVEKDTAKLDNERAKSEAYSVSIIREQEGLIEAANLSITKINTDLKVLKKRLTVYTGSEPKPIDDTYTDLKRRYESKLGERAVLQNAVNMAEESITAAKLHHIPGEDTRV